MREVYKVLFGMAKDKRVSDRNFREAVLSMESEIANGGTFATILRDLHQTAIQSTEFDSLPGGSAFDQA